MADQWVRCNLANAEFPFQTDLAGRSIIIPGYDFNYDRVSTASTTKDRGIPQAFYMHNCLATGQGYQAIGYDTYIAGTPGVTNFDQIFPLEYTVPQVAKVLFSPAGGTNYVYDANVGSWQACIVLGSLGSSLTGSTTAAFSDITYVDMGYKLTNSVIVNRLGAFLTTNTTTTINLYVLQRTAAGDFTVVSSITGQSHPGTGWGDFLLGTPYIVPGTGDFYVGIYMPASSTFNYNPTIANASKAGAGVSGTGWAEATGDCPPVRASTSTAFTVPDNAIVTTAFVNGASYIYYQNIGCFSYDPTTKVMQAVTLNGLNAANIKGVCSANGYMITWTDTSLAWSNTADPTDFIPSLVTGAGGGSVQYAEGKIQFCLPISGGFMIYCEGNCVSAAYSNNVRFPYIFSEVANSGGCQHPEFVSWQGNQGEHYAWTTAGLQSVSRTSAKTVYPEATDFLAALIFEDFDETTLALSVQYLSQPLAMKISAIANRYIILSYGVTSGEYTHALVYDLGLQRWGKLKVTHRDCIEWNAPNIYGEVTYGMLSNTQYAQLSDTTYENLASTGVNIGAIPKKNIAFLQKDGAIKVLNFDLAQTNARGVLIMGKYQFSRNRWIQHQQTDIENTGKGDQFEMYISVSLDGKTLEHPVKLKLVRESLMAKRYAKRLTGQNFSLVFIGAFNLVSLLVHITEHGSR
jgi:hypothetical protein